MSKIIESIINVFEEVGGSAAVSTEDGQGLYNRLNKLFQSGIKVKLNFNNIDLITSTFLNAAIGQLYSKYDSGFIRKHLRIENMTQDDLELLQKVVKRAKDYFDDQKKMETTIKNTFHDS